MEGKAEPTENVFVVGALVTSELIAWQRLTLTEDPRKLRPREKGVGSCEEEVKETQQIVPLGTIDLGSFEMLSDHDDAVEEHVVFDESSEEATGTMPPLPLAP